MDGDIEKFIKINFKTVVKELKIPENYDALPAKLEDTIEFTVEME